MPAYLAAQAAGIGRFEFFQVLVDRGLPVHDEPAENMRADLTELAESLDIPALRQAAATLASDSPSTPPEE